MAGKLIVSLDFELFWGMLDCSTLDAYGSNVLGGKVADIRALTIPSAPIAEIEPMERRIVRIDKVKHTPATYPRHGSKIKKSPL